MRVLVIAVSDSFADSRWFPEIRKLPYSVVAPEEGDTVDLIAVSTIPEGLPPCGLPNGRWTHGTQSMSGDEIYRTGQLSKFCRAVHTFDVNQKYDFYVKIRPDIQMFAPINLKAIKHAAGDSPPPTVYARARVYHGPRALVNGASVGGVGVWSEHRTDSLIPAEVQHSVILDDQVFVVNAAARKAGVLSPLTSSAPIEHEWFHTGLWGERGACLVVIGIDCKLLKYQACSGDLYGWKPRN